MYKAGKNWVFAMLSTIALTGVMAMSVNTAKADTVAQSSTEQIAKVDTTSSTTTSTQATTQLEKATNTTNESNATQTAATTTTEQSSSNASATSSSQNNKQATTTSVSTLQSTSVANKDQASSTQSSTTQKSEEPKVETPVNTADNASQKNVNGNWYLVDNNTGKNLTGFQEIKDQNKVVYYAPSNAQMQYGWQNINSNKYYFDKFSGAMTTGQRNIDGSWYLFDDQGVMQTGLQNLASYGQNKVVYYASNGQMQYGWQNINGKDYYFDTISGAMKTGTVNINGKNYTFNSDGTLKKDTWGWPFPSVGQGSFTGAQLFGVNPGGEFRMNGFHDGLDFGSYDHPGSSVHAVHSGVVTQIGYIAGLENYVVVQSDEYSFVYQEAFSNRGNIKVHVGQQINTGDVIGYRDTSHLHLGITREKNIMRAIANSFNNNGTWLNPLELIRNGIANQ